MATPTQETLREAFSSSVLESVRKLWFSGASGDESQLVLPAMDLAMKWFRSDLEFDKLCA